MILLFAILPPLIIAYYIYQKDKYEKEPKSLIVKSFLFGCIGVIPAIVLESFAEGLFTNLFLYVFLGIAFVEEGIKYFFLKKYLYKKADFNEPMDGIVYAVMISLGFATIENIAYVFGHEGQEIQVAIIRMFSAIPAHALMGVIMGYYVGKAKFDIDNRKTLLLKGLFGAILLHGLYNYFLLSKAGLGIFAIVSLVVAYRFAKRAINESLDSSPFKNI